MTNSRLTALLGILPLLLLLLTGCTKEETAENQDKALGITLALTIPASESALTRATTVPLAGENILSNVYVLFYSKTGNSAAVPNFFYAETNINKEEEWTYNIPIADLKRYLTAGVRYEVYVVASLPTATTAPTATTKKVDLLALSETQFDRKAVPLMSFSGKGEVTYAPNTSSTVDIPLRRTVARLDITVHGLKTGQTAELQLTQTSTTPYFENERIATFEFKTDMLTADADGLYRAYVYENHPSYMTNVKTQLTLTVKSSDGSTPVRYKPIVVNNGKIDRNTIYEMQLDVHYPVINVSQSRVAMDWWNLGKTFDASVDYDSDATMSFVGYVIKNADGTDLSVTTDGSNLPAWLPKANITGLPDGTDLKGQIKLTYTVAETSQYEVALRIRAKKTSRETTEDITVVYDNGYLPNSVLSSPGLWTANQPSNGVHLAKRGNVLTTADAGVEDLTYVWSPNVTEVGNTSQIHGTGAKNTTVIVSALSEVSVARVCNTMGSGWYLSSARELETIRTVKRYLGTSYSINEINNIPANYWSSSQSTTAIIGAYGLDFKTNISAPSCLKTDLYRVRCVRDID